jgi:hypothetical protein
VLVVMLRRRHSRLTRAGRSAIGFPSSAAPRSVGSCPIREHAGDGAYVGRCEFATYDGFCPRHGAVEDYPTRDDREVAVADRRWVLGVR